MPRRIEVRRGWLSDAEIAQLLTYEKIPMYRAIWALMADCGLRTSEVVALGGGDLILLQQSEKENRIIVQDKLRVRGKGDIMRYLPVPNRVRQAVAAYFQGPYDQPSVPCQLRDNKDRLFECAARTIQRRFHHAKRLAGINGDHLCPHSLRHSYATRLISRGVDILTVSHMMGHASLYTTMGYLHTNPDALRIVGAALEAK